MKPKKPYFHNPNVIYKFQCPCSSTYIGETVKLLELRIFQHRTHKTSHVFKHITNCIPYQTSLENTFGNQPNDDQKREHLLNHFTVLERNLTNYFSRQLFEGMMITLHQPDLNKQVYHRSTALICNCVIPSLPRPNPGS